MRLTSTFTEQKGKEKKGERESTYNSTRDAPTYASCLTVRYVTLSFIHHLT